MTPQERYYHFIKYRRERQPDGLQCPVCWNPLFDRLPETVEEYDAATEVVVWCPTNSDYETTRPK